MSTITVNVTNPGAANVSVSGGSTVNATVGNGGSVAVGIGSISPGNASVVSGTLTINSTTTLSAGSSAYAKNVGTAYAAAIDLGIPAGAFTNVAVGNTTTLNAGLNATVTSSANGANLTLAFGIPRGAGGTNGTNGTNGITPAFAIGTVTTGDAGSNAAVTATTTNNGANVTINLTIPRGADGASGTNGTNGSNGTNISLSSATPSNLGTASAGSSNLAARGDHVHALPVIAYANLSDVPSNFPTNTTLVSGLSSGYSAANHGHNYVTSLNGITGAVTLAAGGNVTLSANSSTLTISSAGGGIGENDAVDGGSYIGEILGGITFSLQPQSQSLTTTSSVTLTQWGSLGSANVAYGTGLASASAHAAGNVLLAQFRDYGTGSTYPEAHIIRSVDNGATWDKFLLLAKNSSASPVLYGEIVAASNGTRTVFTTGVSASSTDANGGNALRLRYSDSQSLSSPQEVGGALAGRSVAYNNSAARFVAIAEFSEDNGDTIYSSSDGVNWSLRSTPNTFNALCGVFVVGSNFVTVPGNYYYSGAVYSMRSSTGVTWTSTTRPIHSTDAASNGTRLVALRGTTTFDYTSDGATWSTATLPTACDKIDYTAGLFWAFSSLSSTDVLTSPDGVTWTLRDMPVSRKLVAAASAASSGIVLLTTTTQDQVRVAFQTASASANLTVSASASSGNPVSYQWQSSADAGTTWASINGATSTALNLTGLTTADSGRRYRSQASATGAATQSSQSATLTVTE